MLSEALWSVKFRFYYQQFRFSALEIEWRLGLQPGFAVYAAAGLYSHHEPI